MELVYLWVEDYKNIHKQGFNFSPRFECKFHDEYDEKGKLKIIEKKEDEYIKDFFGDNINVTAIVGKNGSGKSSVLEILNMDKECVFKAYSATSDNKINELDCSSLNVLSIKDNLNTNHFYEQFKKLMDKDSKKFDFINKSFIFDKYYLYINEPSSLEKEKIFWKLLLETMKDNMSVYSGGFLESSPDEIAFKKEYDELINKLGKLDTEKIKEKYDRFADYLNKTKMISNIPKFTKDDIKRASHNFTYDETLNLYKTNNMKFSENINDELINLLKKKLLIKENYINTEDTFSKYDYSSLSAGEQRLLSLFTNLFYQKLISEKEKEIDVILLDEPDTFLHPQWQKELFSLIVKGFKKIKLNNCHIILTSHSPFLLSDIPRQNIIFLDKDEKGNCKVVDGLKEKKQTFGANIHTLLSDSFFMEDGLMGEFAKGKIDEVIEYLNGKKDTNIKNDDEAQKLVNIIGEPIVKNQLQRMLDSKRLKKVDKIDDIEKDIRALQEALAKLKK